MGVTGLNKADRATERGPVVVVVVAAIASLGVCPRNNVLSDMRH